MRGRISEGGKREGKSFRRNETSYWGAACGTARAKRGKKGVI